MRPPIERRTPRTFGLGRFAWPGRSSRTGPLLDGPDGGPHDRPTGLRTLILAAGVGAGHNQAGNAVEHALAQLPEVDQVLNIDILETTNEAFQKLYDDGYFALVDEAPWVVGWGYDSQDSPFKLAPLVQWWDQLNTTAVVRRIRDYDPDVVICTHYLPARLVSLMLARRQLRASLSVVTTDYDFQGLWLTSPFNHFFVARDEAYEHMANLGVPRDRIRVSGIPVRHGLADHVDAAAVRKRFGLHPRLPIVLISAGASGGSYTLNIVRQVRRSDQRFQAVVVCGRNQQLRGQIAEIVKNDPERFRVLGYTTEMADLMRISTLFVGKPGGLSSSECMAAGLPMAIINPIPGQEVRNADFLVEEGAAVRCNYATTVGYKIDSLLADHGRLRAMAANARRIGRPDAGHAVATDSLASPVQPLWIGREAKKSMLLAGEEGIPAADLPDERMLRSLTDPVTGASLALVTQAQLRPLGVTDWSTSVRVSRKALRALVWQPDNLDLVVTCRWLLGAERSRIFGLS
ncbi:MAG: glycosyltransferase [Micropruina sp.]|uniref:MGDG synthase family glycosyltransferase n=1 Tax=Micropruina sp. TaxID=2737536 RepID=UPI0039E48730